MASGLISAVARMRGRPLTNLMASALLGIEKINRMIVNIVPRGDDRNDGRFVNAGAELHVVLSIVANEASSGHRAQQHRHGALF